MSESRLVLDIWSEFKLLVEQLEEDLHKNAAKGNFSAGVRVRKSVRKLRTLGAELIKATQTADNTRKEERKSAE